MPPSVSVIITCYNLELYIVEALNSVLTQDYPGEVEIVVVDDCSKDGSVDRIRPFSQARLIQNEANQGVLLSTVRGIEASSHNLVFFLDGDDRWHPEKISTLVELFEGDEAMVMATHDLRYIDENGAEMYNSTLVAERMSRIEPGNWSTAIRDGILDQDDFIWLGSAWALRKKLGQLAEFAEFARGLPDPHNTYQDWPLAAWVASLPGNPGFGYSPKALFDYRIHGANHSGDARTVDRARRNFLRARNSLDAMLRAVDVHGVEKSRLSSLRKLRFYYAGIVDLYDGHRLSGLRAFPKVVPLLVRRKSFAKEFVRFAALALFGPSFVAWLTRQAAKAR